MCSERAGSNQGATQGSMKTLQSEKYFPCPTAPQDEFNSHNLLVWQFMAQPIFGVRKYEKIYMPKKTNYKFKLKKIFMKKIYIKLFTILLAVALVAGVSIFNACKKEEAVKDVLTQEWQEKIEYMDIPCVDFSRIKKKATKGETMLQFDSWEHYASVIDAMLEFSYEYIATRVRQIREENPDIDDDDLSLIIHNEGIYQFMPLYSFCQQLQFDNNAFQRLRTEEIQRMNSQTFESNPFDEMKLGYIQSALHNIEGKVMIGGEIFNPSVGIDDEGGEDEYSCATNKYLDNSSTGNQGIWPTYYYAAKHNQKEKKREFRAKIHSCQAYSYAKTSVYYYDFLGSLIVWCCDIHVDINGKRLKQCHPSTTSFLYFNEHGNVNASVVEKYCWHSLPNYLHPDGNAVVFSLHSAPGSSALSLSKRSLGL